MLQSTQVACTSKPSVFQLFAFILQKRDGVSAERHALSGTVSGVEQMLGIQIVVSALTNKLGVY